MRTSALLLSAVLPLALALAGCAKPKQAEAPDLGAQSGADNESGMDVGNVDPSAVPREEGDKPPEAAEMHAKCCGECKVGLEKDRTGQPADKIPCVDFTEALSPWCLEHFRGTPTKASECK